MPGLVGFINPYDDRNKNFDLIDSMLHIITYSNNYSIEKNVVDPYVSIGKSEHVLLRTHSDQYSAEGVYVWMNGEFYEDSDEKITLILPYTKLLWYHYKNSSLNYFLESINGSFSACIYDSEKHCILLVTDRFGSRYMYWGKAGNSLIWASEIKCMIHYPGFPLEIDRNGVEDFVYLGYMLGNRTLLQGVRMLDAASVLSYDLADGAIRIEKYWVWDRRPKMLLQKDEEFTEQLGEIFQGAVAKRCNVDTPMTVLLSGGYDSRAILAAIPETIRPLYTVTFGEEGNQEIAIAQKYAAIKKTIHKIKIFKTDNRLTTRIKQVWWTDGHYSILHMHAASSAEEKGQVPSIVLHGAASEILGESIAMYSSDEAELYIHKEIAYPNLPPDKKEEIIECIMQYELFHDFFVDNYTRKFNLNGIRTGISGGAHIRTPFMDNDLMAFIRLIPIDLKKDRKIYRKMLQEKFPDYFPSNNRSLFDHVRRSNIYKTLRNLRRGKFRKQRSNVTQRIKTKQRGFLENEITQQFIKDMLVAKDAYTVEYFPENRAADWFEQLLQGNANYAELLGRLLTVEIWLKLLYDKKIDGHFELD